MRVMKRGKHVFGGGACWQCMTEQTLSGGWAALLKQSVSGAVTARLAGGDCAPDVVGGVELHGKRQPDARCCVALES